MSLTPRRQDLLAVAGDTKAERESCTQGTSVGHILIGHVQSSGETQVREMSKEFQVLGGGCQA